MSEIFRPSVKWPNAGIDRQDDPALMKVWGCCHRQCAVKPGYRHYQEQDVQQLRFIRQARELGFRYRKSVNCLIYGMTSSDRSGKVKQVAQQHITVLEQKLLN